ncbi:MAG TPA: amylo-alpha-1,6-glucosidase [Pyrinomonadaceae bacterium]|jgi:predicted glycogen debranching enzyme|nr:amylo-alpha-1,6-glucosidase [Pyrinomonadaceae bacterium]
MRLDADIASDFTAASTREWLETNGIGGYASGTVAGLHTRRYHGLLVAATRPPLGRLVLLSKFEEKLIIDGRQYELSANRYPGVVSPTGFQYLVKFRLDPFPIWTYQIHGLRLEKSIFMVHGENTTVCRWSLLDPTPDVWLEVRPLIASRDHHHLQHEREDVEATSDVVDRVVSYQMLADTPTVNFAHNARGVEVTDNWYRNFEYAIELERGFDFHEDLLQPFMLRFDLANDAVVVASTEDRTVADSNEFATGEIARRQALIEMANVSDDPSRQLLLAADQFIVDRGGGKTVIAGYHWFSDWGRDTMIALNGLTLATNRPEIARSIILEYSRHISDGMLPNRFPDEGETPEYNTVDATLWYFEAIRAFVAATDDLDLVREIYTKLIDIIDWHVSGTRYGIKVDSDGLLHAGEAGSQLTWMDAKVGDLVITPRTGKPVEIQALWYNTLCVMCDLAREVGDERRSEFLLMAAKAKRNFNELFWNDADQCLYDVINGEWRDASVRPNQIFAVSLLHTMLPAAKARKVVDKVEAELLTPVGLRSLSPGDPRYVGTYIGSPFERDSAYHQGTVWAWLIGPFVDAYRKVHSNDSVARRRMGEIIEGLEATLSQTMLGQIGEIFDGDPPHASRGAAAQAWSVAELLRIKKQLG